MKKNEILSIDDYNNFTKPTIGSDNYEAFELGKEGLEANPYEPNTSNFKQYQLGYAYGQGLKGNTIELSDIPELSEANQVGINEYNSNKKRGWFTNFLIWIGLKKEEDFNEFVDNTLEEIIPFNNATASMNTGTLVIITIIGTIFIMKHKQIMGFFSDVSAAGVKATR